MSDHAKSLTAAVLLCAAVNASRATAGEQNFDFRIDAQPIGSAMNEFSERTQIEFYLPPDPRWDHVFARPVHGLYRAEAALGELLAGTGLKYEFDGPKWVDLVPTENNGASSTADAAHQPVVAADGIPEVLVKGLKASNVDIPRNRDDAQRRVVINREEIDHSQSGSIEGLISKEVPASVHGNELDRAGPFLSGTSQVNLRGLGPNQTLLLIDGRRPSSPLVGGSAWQGDLTPIPVDAVERIEILPSSGSGIYGGGATGGVVNIILRRDCTDSRLKLEYGNSFASDAGQRRLFFTHCISSEGGVRLKMTAGLSRDAILLTQDRDFAQRGRDAIELNNPGYFPGGQALQVGRQVNRITEDGLFTTIPDGYQSAMGPGPLLANAGHYNLQLANTAQAEGGGRYALRSGPETRYLNAKLDREFGELASGFVEFTSALNVVRSPASVSEYAGLRGVPIPANAPNNVLHQAMIVTIPAIGGDDTSENRIGSQRLVAGLTFTPFDDWSFGAEYSATRWTLKWRQPVANTAVAKIRSGELDVFRDVNERPLDLTSLMGDLYTSPVVSSTNAVSVRAAGTLAGDVKITGLLERRDETFRGGTEVTARPDGTVKPTAVMTEQALSVDSAYVELSIPAGPRVARGSALFELQLAGRVDRYRSNSGTPRIAPGAVDDARSRSGFTTANPSVGLQVNPSSWITLRGNFNTGFLPPSANQLVPALPRVYPAGAFRDPSRGGEDTKEIRFLGGGNPDLLPERSKSWSAGFLLRPLDDLTWSLDFTRLFKTDEIANLADALGEDLVEFGWT